MIRFILRLFFVLFIFMCKFSHSTELTDPRKVCPPSDLIEPCTCYQDGKEKYDDLMCALIDSVEALEDIPLKIEDYEFGSITLFYSRIQYIPAKILGIKGLKKVNIIHMTLDTLFRESPTDNNTVEHIMMTMTEQPGGMDWKYFAAFSNLKSLFFFFNPGLKFDHYFTKNMPKSLVKLKVLNCAARRIGDGAFAGLNNLEEIVFQKEMVRELKRNMFPSPTKLHTFDFRKNQLTSLPNDLFDGMASLRRIYLSENHLTSISEKIFHKIIPQLTILDIGSNPINCKCDLLWITEPESHPERLMGSCQEPATLSERAIVDLTPEHFSHCSINVSN